MACWLESAHTDVSVHGGCFPLPRLSTEWEEWEWVYWSDFSFKPTPALWWTNLGRELKPTHARWRCVSHHVQKSKSKLKKNTSHVIQLIRTFCSSYNWRHLYSCLAIRPGEVEKKGTIYPTVCESCTLYQDFTSRNNRERRESETHGQDDKSQGVLCHLSLYEIARE